MASQKGFGLSPAGLSAFGFGSPATTDKVTSRVFAMTDGIRTAGSSRKINPQTRDYVINEDTGRMEGMTEAQQLVYFSLITVKGSSIDAEMGSEVSLIGTITENTAAIAESLIRSALAPHVSSGVVQIENIAVRTDGGQLQYSVDWLDVESKQKVTTKV